MQPRHIFTTRLLATNGTLTSPRPLPSLMKGGERETRVRFSRSLRNLHCDAFSPPSSPPTALEEREKKGASAGSEFADSRRRFRAYYTRNGWERSFLWSTKNSRAWSKRDWLSRKRDTAVRQVQAPDKDLEPVFEQQTLALPKVKSTRPAFFATKSYSQFSITAGCIRRGLW